MSKKNWKRGPMPLTAKRDLYVQSMSQGMQNSAAWRQVGVNRKTGQRWRLGRIVNDAKGGEYRYDLIVPPGSAGSGSGRYLSDQERIVIADGLRAGRSRRSIAGELGRSVSMVCREVLRNAEVSGEYRPHAAQQRMLTRRPRPKLRRLAINAEVRGLVQDRLGKRWSPEQISNSLRVERPDRPDLHLAPESIYHAIYEPSNVLTRSPRMTLRTGRTNRRRRRRCTASSRFVVPMTPIKQRPEAVEDRVEGGHWEGDLITGTMNQSAIGTLVGRSSRFTILVHFVGTHDAEQLRDSMTEIFTQLPANVRRSLTWDQGIEMARHHESTAATTMPVYFCDPRSPWQRGTNENTNGLLRQYFPKGTDLSVYSIEDLQHAADELNDRPRKSLGWRTPAAVFAALKLATV
jgi:IS30 family transposase